MKSNFLVLIPTPRKFIGFNKNLPRDQLFSVTCSHGVLLVFVLDSWKIMIPKASGVPLLPFPLRADENLVKKGPACQRRKGKISGAWIRESHYFLKAHWSTLACRKNLCDFFPINAAVSLQENNIKCIHASLTAKFTTVSKFRSMISLQFSLSHSTTLIRCKDGAV